MLAALLLSDEAIGWKLRPKADTTTHNHLDRNIHIVL